MGFGDTRFASPKDAFKLLYIAKTPATSVAETIVRDRFEGNTARELTRGEIADWGVCEVSATAPLRVLDLRANGCFKLGISTDIVGGKAQKEARDFSQELYDTTNLDGILYKSRLLKNQDCVAVYDRAVVHKLNSTPVVRMETLAQLVPALRRLKITLI
jgi:RES domain